MNALILLCLVAAIISTATGIPPKAEICATIYDPVCSSHGKTFSNECEFQSELDKIPDIYILYRGRCEDRAVPTGNCSCPGLNPVCGSDGVVYNNICKLTCNQKFDIDLVQVDMNMCPKLERR